ncbi:MAG: hypothetical protein ACK47B_10860 [Armatimonadota bacterium]
MSTIHRQHRKQRTFFRLLAREQRRCFQSLHDRGELKVPDEPARPDEQDDWADEEDDDPGQQGCLRCGAPSWYVRTGYCSDECLGADAAEIEDEGRCGHCGRPGPYGEPCFRPLDGQLEECGQFI